MDGIAGKPGPALPATERPSPEGVVDESYSGLDQDRTTLDPDAQICERARLRFEYVGNVDSLNRRYAADDLKFAWERGGQWNEDMRRKRETANPPRPWLEFNQLGQFIKGVVNEQRQNRPAIKIRPEGGKATETLADINEGLIRHIEYASNAEAAYATGLEAAATAGRGYWRVVTAYEAEDSFNQILKILPVPNSLSVYLDPDTIEADKSDAKYGFICEWLDRETFEKEWPEAEVAGWDGEGDDPYAMYFDGGKICVADYYECVEEDQELVALSDQSVMWRDQYEAKLEAMLAAMPPPMPDPMSGLLPDPMQGVPQVMRSETRKRTRVDWYKLTAAPKPLAKYQWKGRYVPIVCCPGDEMIIEGRRTYQGMVRRVRDAQMMYNFWFTMVTEKIAMAPRAPYIGLDGQFEGHPEWDDFNSENYGYLEYEPVELEDGSQYTQAPQQTPPVPVEAGILSMLQLAADNLKNILGMQNATVGQADPNMPWRSVWAQQQRGDNATFHYGDNQRRAIGYTGRILVDLIPEIYDAKRAIIMLGEDGEQQSVVVNQPMPDGPMLNDLKAAKGQLGVVVDVGPSYQTKRVEATNDMQQFMKAMPDAAPFIGDLFAKMTDWPGDLGEKVSARLFAMLPPQIQALDQGGDPQVVGLQNQMQQMQAQFQQMAQQMQGAMAKLQQDNSELKLENMNNKMDFAAKMAEQASKRQATEMTRAAESENSASQEFIAKLDAIPKMLDNFVKLIGLGVDPNALVAAATQAVTGASSAVRTGPDFGDSLALLQRDAMQGNAQAAGIVNSVFPGGLPPDPAMQGNGAPPPMPQGPPQPNGGMPPQPQGPQS